MVGARCSSSAFSGRAFPDDIIALAVRWYVRYRLSYVEVNEWLAERGVLVDQHHFAVRYGISCRCSARWRERTANPSVRTGEWTRRTLVSEATGITSIAPDGHGQIVDAYVSPTRDTIAARRFFERASASSATTPRRVITDKAATYPPALAAAVPGVLHRTGRYRTNGIERDHGFLKERLRPMRGLKSVASAAIFMVGHVLMRNIRR